MIRRLGEGSMAGSGSWSGVDSALGAACTFMSIVSVRYWSKEIDETLTGGRKK